MKNPGHRPGFWFQSWTPNKSVLVLTREREKIFQFFTLCWMETSNFGQPGRRLRILDVPLFPSGPIAFVSPHALDGRRRALNAFTDHSSESHRAFAEHSVSNFRAIRGRDFIFV